MLTTIKRTVGAVLALIALAVCISPGALAANSSEDRLNRYNVVLVLDASGSMRTSDPEGLRFEAIKEFVYLLAKTGNHVGAVVFTDKVKDKAVEEMVSRANKDAVIASLESVPASGWTNIGGALNKAVDMLEQGGDPTLPSVILFLSDGNTEMGTTKELEDSLKQKADAIDRASEKGIEIFSVCLNVDHSADVSEMRQISNATSARFEEVNDAQDLYRVLDYFYSMIYGTTSIPIWDEPFGASGVIEKEFDVPGIGVEEINITIEGRVTSAELTRPNGAPSGSAEVYSSKTFAFIKEPNAEAGRWKLVAEGNPGDPIHIKLRYNSNLEIELEQEPPEPPENGFHTGDALTVRAKLRDGSKTATSEEQYKGYDAELVLLDAITGSEVQRINMASSKNGFEHTLKLENGVYRYYVAVSGNSLNKTSDESERIKVTTPAQPGEPPEPPEPPLPPEPKEEQVNIKKYLWPFVDNSLRIDFEPLATDPKGLALSYRVVNSAFMPEEYTADEYGLTQTSYSLRKGFYTIRATNTDGMSCDIRVVVTSIRVGLIAMILLVCGVLLTLVVLGILAWIASTKPFGGSIECSVAGGQKVVRKPKRGKIELSAFALPPCGIDYQKCHFQASGDRYITLVSKIPLNHGGRMEKEITIHSGKTEIVKSGANGGKNLSITFTSRKPVRGVRQRGSRPASSRTGRSGGI